MQNPDSWFTSKFLSLKEKVAIINKDKRYTYSNLLDQINAFDRSIQSEIPAGTVVALLSDYSFQSIALFFSLVRNRNTIVPVISQNEAEIEHRITISCASKKITISGERLQISDTGNTSDNALFEKLRKPDHAGLVLFSSGVTDQPKAMLHDLDQLISGYRKDVVKEINSIIFLTFDHIGGIDTLLSLLSIGGTVTIPETRDPKSICALIENHKVNVLSCSPTFLNLLILSEAYKSYNLGSLQIIGFGAEQMPEFLLQKIKDIFPNVRIQQKFGTSETNAIRVKNHPTQSLFMKIDDPNIQYKIVDHELWLKSATQILGYLNKNSEDFEDGWFKTGDVVSETDDGYFRIIGRKKEVINVGGEKVFPGEVENVILQLRSVTGCSVYGIKNLITGEIVVAEVTIITNGDSTEIKKEIKEICARNLDPYKRPAKIKVVEGLTMNERFKKLRKPGN